MDTKITCPKCNNPDCGQEDEYCWNCGAELINYCTNPECPQLAVLDGTEPSVVLPSNFTFCPYCGSPTHFSKIGYTFPLEFDP